MTAISATIDYRFVLTLFDFMMITGTYPH